MAKRGHGMALAEKMENLKRFYKYIEGKRTIRERIRALKNQTVAGDG